MFPQMNVGTYTHETLAACHSRKWELYNDNGISMQRDVSLFYYRSFNSATTRRASCSL